MNPQFIALAPDQLLSLMATQIAATGRTAAEAVALAVEIVAEASLATNRGDILASVNAKSPDFQEEQRAKVQASQRGIMVPGGGPIPPELLQRNRQRQ